MVLFEASLVDIRQNGFLYEDLLNLINVPLNVMTFEYLNIQVFK